MGFITLKVLELGFLTSFESCSSHPTIFTMTLKQDYLKMQQEMKYYKKRCEELMLEIIRLNKKKGSKHFTYKKQ